MIIQAISIKYYALEEWGEKEKFFNPFDQIWMVEKSNALMFKIRDFISNHFGK